MGSSSAKVVKVPSSHELARVVAEELSNHLRERSNHDYLRITTGEWKLDEKSPKDGDLLILLRREFNLHSDMVEECNPYFFNNEEWEELLEAWLIWCKVPVWVKAQLLLGIWEWQWESRGKAVADRFLLQIDRADLWDVFPAIERHYVEYED